MSAGNEPRQQRLDRTLGGLAQGRFTHDTEQIMINRAVIVVTLATIAPWQAFVDTTKDTLKNAPKFTYSKNKRS
jgi:hypothetical protein